MAIDIRTDHIAAGDTMQSSLSRLLEWARPHLEAERSSMPYEVRMAFFEGERAVEEWTVARRADSR